MKKYFILFNLIFLLDPSFSSVPAGYWEPIEKVFHRKGVFKEDVFKITFPRTDLKVRAGNISIEPGFALTSWIAFKPAGNEYMMMGDLVLKDHEIGPVISKLVENHIEITGLHNHIVGESPSIMYLHFSGHGHSATTLAENIKKILLTTKTPMQSPQSTVSMKKELDWSNVETILGFKGQAKGNLLQFSIPRNEEFIEKGMIIPPFMGMASVINFQKVGTKAAITGDFVLLADEVDPVVKTLTRNGIIVTALHNHMLYESPRLFFLHFWGVDNPDTLARGLKSAVDITLNRKE